MQTAETWISFAKDPNDATKICHHSYVVPHVASGCCLPQSRTYPQARVHLAIVYDVTEYDVMKVTEQKDRPNPRAACIRIVHIYRDIR